MSSSYSLRGKLDTVTVQCIPVAMHRRADIPVQCQVLLLSPCTSELITGGDIPVQCQARLSFCYPHAPQS